MSTVGRSQWIYGIVGGFDLTKKTAVMAELHGMSRTNFSRQTWTLNFGLRRELTESRILILSVGRDLDAPEAPAALIGYCGMQFLF